MMQKKINFETPPNINILARKKHRYGQIHDEKATWSVVYFG